MKKEIVSQSASQEPARKMRGTRRPVATLMAVIALIACASSSALAIPRCEPVEFSENGNGFPFTAYVYATTATTGATILATVGVGYIPANPTHDADCSPTGTTFICGGTFAVFAGQHKYFKAIACIADSAMTSYDLDNSGD